MIKRYDFPVGTQIESPELGDWVKFGDVQEHYGACEHKVKKLEADKRELVEMLSKLNPTIIKSNCVELDVQRLALIAKHKG